MRFRTNLISLLCLSCLALTSLISSQVALAQTNPLNTGLNTTAGVAGYPDAQNQGVAAPKITLTDTWLKFLNYGIDLVGIIFLLLILYAGYIWITDRGSEHEVEKAKLLITQAIIGLIITLGARIIVEFTLTNVPL